MLGGGAERGGGGEADRGLTVRSPRGLGDPGAEVPARSHSADGSLLTLSRLLLPGTKASALVCS